MLVGQGSVAADSVLRRNPREWEAATVVALGTIRKETTRAAHSLGRGRGSQCHKEQREHARMHAEVVQILRFKSRDVKVTEKN